MPNDQTAHVRAERAEYRAKAVKLAAIPAYQSVTLTLRERLADSDPIRLGAKAGEYAEQVATRLSTVGDLLEQIREDEQRISQLLCTHTRQLLSNLAAAARASKLPAGLAGMSTKQFLNLRFDNPTEEELESRVTQQVITLLGQAGGDTKSLPSGEKILRQCVHAAVGVKGFRVDVLKPNEHMLEQRVPYRCCTVQRRRETHTCCSWPRLRAHAAAKGQVEAARLELSCWTARSAVLQRTTRRAATRGRAARPSGGATGLEHGALPV